MPGPLPPLKARAVHPAPGEAPGKEREELSVVPQPQEPEPEPQPADDFPRRLAELQNQARRMYSVVCAVAGVGVLFAVCAVELDDDDASQDALLWLISADTVVLLLALGEYYRRLLEVERLETAEPTLALIHSSLWWPCVLEFLVCAAHVPPGLDSEPISMDFFQDDGDLSEVRLSASYLNLALAMRAYLVPRLLLYQSSLSAHNTRMMLSLNAVRLDTGLGVKVALHLHPISTLSMALLFVLLLNSYVFRICERTVSPPLDDFRAALWSQVVTISTVGYGDIVADTTCGRMVSVVSMGVGAVVSALLIAVVSKALALSKGQVKVVELLQTGAHRKRITRLAALVVQHQWLAYHERNEGDTVADNAAVRLAAAAFGHSWRVKAQQTTRAFRKARRNQQQQHISSFLTANARLDMLVRRTTFLEHKLDATVQSQRELHEKVDRVLGVLTDVVGGGGGSAATDAVEAEAVPDTPGTAEREASAEVEAELAKL